MRLARLRRRVLGALALWAGIEALCALGLAVLAHSGLEFLPVPSRALSAPQQESIRKILAGEAQYLAFSAALGWTIRPQGEAGLFHADEAGRRRGSTAPGRARLLAFGDSFTHGDEVEDGQTWPAQLGAQSMDLEVHNYGVPGYGADQAYLRYEAEGGRADVVILGFMSADLARVTNTFPPFLEPRTALALPKPSLEAAEPLTWRPNPVAQVEGLRALLDQPEATLARLGQDDPYFQGSLRQSAWDVLPSARLLRLSLAPRDPFAGVLGRQAYSVSTVAFAASVALISTWDQRVRDQQGRFCTLLLPGLPDLNRLQHGGLAAYAPLRKALEARGLCVIDAAPALLAADLAPLFMPGGHYSAEGNRRVADAVAAWLAGSAAP